MPRRLLAAALLAVASLLPAAAHATTDANAARDALFGACRDMPWCAEAYGLSGEPGDAEADAQIFDAMTRGYLDASRVQFVLALDSANYTLDGNAAENESVRARALAAALAQNLIEYELLCELNYAPYYDPHTDSVACACRPTKKCHRHGHRGFGGFSGQDGIDGMTEIVIAVFLVAFVVFYFIVLFRLRTQLLIRRELEEASGKGEDAYSRVRDAVVWLLHAL